MLAGSQASAGRITPLAVGWPRSERKNEAAPPRSFKGSLGMSGAAWLTDRGETLPEYFAALVARTTHAPMKAKARRACERRDGLRGFAVRCGRLDGMSRPARESVTP